MKWLVSIFLFLFVNTLHATELSDECLRSMQQVYKFYYHEILPKGETTKAADQLGEKEATQMVTVVNDLKSHCPGPLIATMNQYLQADNA